MQVLHPHRSDVSLSGHCIQRWTFSWSPYWWCWLWLLRVQFLYGKGTIFCFTTYLGDILMSRKSCLYSNPPSSDLASNDPLVSLESIFTMISKVVIFLSFFLMLSIFYAYQLFKYTSNKFPLCLNKPELFSVTYSWEPLRDYLHI